jgi:polysaccharide biosynthesis protein PslH
VSVSTNSGIERRRILWLSHFLPWPPKGGLMQRSYHLMREVARYHDVCVIAFRQQAHQRDDAELNEAVAAISEFCMLAHVSDLPEDRRPGGRPALALRALLPGPPYTVRWGSCRSYRNAVKRTVADFRPEICHFDTISLAQYRDLLGRIPLALNHHNIESHMLLRRAEKEQNRFKSIYYHQEGRRLARYERSVAKAFQLHLVCAELDGERLEETVGSVPFQVVPNGVDLEYFEPAPAGTRPQPDSMIFVGGLAWYPNAGAMRFFVRNVWPILAAKRPTAELRIIGRHPPPDLVEAAARDHRIKVQGFVDDIRPVVADSMVYVCPISDGGGTKLKMIDAMAMGKAIVAHPVAAEGLGLSDGKDVFLTENPAEMADICIRLFDDEGLRTRTGQAARSRAEEAFGFDAIGAALARTYAALGHRNES